jgi:hypothetical protein
MRDFYRTPGTESRLSLSAHSGSFLSASLHPRSRNGETWCLTKRTEDEERWNRLQLTFAIDKHIVIDQEPAQTKLRLHIRGWIMLVMTDVTRTEWPPADSERRQQLEMLAIDYLEYWGALTLDHSRLDSNVWGTPQDQERLHRVFAILWPNKTLEQARKQDVRDAMNVALAIRYGVNGLITRDGEGRKGTLLKRADPIRTQFDGFRILSPEQALAFVERTFRRCR